MLDALGIREEEQQRLAVKTEEERKLVRLELVVERRPLHEIRWEGLRTLLARAGSIFIC